MVNMLNYHVKGSGPGLVLVHGTSGTGLTTWAPVLDSLAAERTLVLPDLPGSGGSEAAPLDIDVIADQIVAAAIEAGLETFAIAGISLGAPIAIHVAAGYPERVTELISVVGFAKARPSLRMNLEIWSHLIGDSGVGLFLLTLLFSESFLATLSAAQVQQLMSMLAADLADGTAAQIDFGISLDVRADLAKITVPTLVISAAEDQFVPPVHSHELVDGIRDVRFVVVPGGHAAIFEDPKPTLGAFMDFLNY
jgi:pimeloyl-ACP methyl ester carboxylesterase